MGHIGVISFRKASVICMIHHRDALAADKPPVILILAGHDHDFSRSVIASMAETPSVQIAGVLTLLPRPRTLKEHLEELLRRLSLCGVDPAMVDQVISLAFPDKPLTIQDFQRKIRLPVYQISNLSGPAATGLLTALNADYWVLLDPPSRLPVGPKPRLGTLEAHLEVPESFTGSDPVGAAAQAQIVLVRPDRTASVIASRTLHLHRRETEQTLDAKFLLAAPGLFLQAFCSLSREDAAGEPYAPVPRKPAIRSNPGPTVGPSTAYRALKFFIYCILFYSGIFHLLRSCRHWMMGNYAQILAYHRVNDLTNDPLTVGVRRFAEHLLALKRQYSVVSTRSLVDSLSGGPELPESAVAIHFDDCYRDIHTIGGRILSHLGMTACAFVSSGFVDTDRAFAHDIEKSPLPAPNLKSEDLKAMIGGCFELGAHTVNHTDLGRCSARTAEWEIRQSKTDLEAIVHQAIDLFAFPFGRPDNISPSVKPIIQAEGFRALFSAYGGFNTRSTDPFEVRRIGMSGQFTVLEMLFEIEGITPGALLGKRSSFFTPYS